MNRRGQLATRNRKSKITNLKSKMAPMPEFKKFTVEERVRWGDVDAARIIFYGAYIHLFEFAETELFRAVGLPYGVMFDELDIWLPRVHLECDFHHAAQLDDLLEVSETVPIPKELREKLAPYCQNRER